MAPVSVVGLDLMGSGRVGSSFPDVGRQFSGLGAAPGVAAVLLFFCVDH